MTDTFRALCAELHAAFNTYAVDECHHALLERTRATLAKADEPAVPEGREPVAVTKHPSDEEWDALVERSWDKYKTVGYQGERFMYDSDFDNALEFVRRELALWGTSNLTELRSSPDDGEVAELVAWLRETGDTIQPSHLAEHQRYKRAAELLERQVVVPVPVSERLPEPSTKVLAHYFNDLGRKRTICAIWVPAKSRSGDIGDDDDFTEYDEEDGKFYWPEGWYEAIENWDDLGWIHVDEGEVVYWQPLPKWPAHALPLPEVD